MKILRNIILKGVFQMCIITSDSIFEFCRAFDWQKRLGELKNIILPENWTYIEGENDEEKYPILENYVIHTFKRLYHLCKNNPDNEKKYLCCNDEYLCFNIGLYTCHYEKTFVLMKKEIKTDDDKLWSFTGYLKESDYRLESFEYLPAKIDFIEKIEDLIYDTTLELRINSTHILSDEKNKERIPEEIRNQKNLQTLFDGAIAQVKRKVECNYKIAVPQYYEGKVQLLLPLCLIDPEKVDLVLVVTRRNNYYIGKTCLTLDMAYNNARLIAKPETSWLSRS